MEQERKYGNYNKYKKYRRKTKEQQTRDLLRKILISSLVVFIVIIYVFIFRTQFLKLPNATKILEDSNAATMNSNWSVNDIEKPDWIEINHIEVNPYSRPGDKLEAVNGIVIHYTGNPGTTAEQHQHYYGELAKTGERSASSNFVIGNDGKIIECVPEDEVAYASNDRNSDTISIECCHQDETGKFTEKTYDSLVKLSAYLCAKYDLNEEQILRHYDITGKECPKYYVTYEAKWTELKEDIMKEKNRYN